MKVQIEVADSRLADILVGAREGGSNYWMKQIKPLSGMALKKDPQISDFDAWYGDMIKNGFTIVQIEKHEDNAPDKYEITNELICKGLQVMHDKYPAHYAAIVEENDDAETSDVFLQCCVFGELIYG